MFERISIIGDGAMASVLAMILCRKAKSVTMWGHDGGQLRQIADRRENVKFLAGYKLPETLKFEADDAKIFVGADIVISAVPCQFVRGVWGRLSGYYSSSIPLISVTKGIENNTLFRPSEILRDVLGEVKVAALSGPTIADELARGLPAVACAASVDTDLAKKVQHTLSAPWFRVYTNSDIVGVELAGAMKNIIAIAAGIIDGIGGGDNAKAALLSRGLAEISRLGAACGARPETFAGVAGLGDLVTTCVSPTGRNRSFGERVGKGMSVEKAQRVSESVIEGIATCKSVVSLASKHGVEMPITRAVYDILFEGKGVKAAMEELMNRQLKAE